MILEQEHITYNTLLAGKYVPAKNWPVKNRYYLEYK